MQEKLPMALIHEGVGKVLLDKTGEFKKGDKVVILPNTKIKLRAILKVIIDKIVFLCLVVQMGLCKN